uniref:Uncharacterized protein n=1 Tax=Sipha flava TaxID=143950 RepID=A0A2S2QPT3_9HEMI
MALETCEHCSRRRLGYKSRGKRRRMEVMNSERHLADAVGIGPTDWSLSRRQVLAGRWQHSVRTGRLRDPPTTGRDDELYQNRRPIRPRYEAAKFGFAQCNIFAWAGPDNDCVR